jgi:hypothetical protein
LERTKEKDGWRQLTMDFWLSDCPWGLHKATCISGALILTQTGTKEVRLSSLSLFPASGRWGSEL